MSVEHSLEVHHCQHCDLIQCGDKAKFAKHVQCHVNVAERKSLGCFSCGVRSSSRKLLNEHLTEVHKNTCEKCNKSFQNATQFRKHHAIVHKSENQGKKTNLHGKGPSDGKYYTCHLCGKQFGHSSGLSYHLRHVHEGIKEHECDICGRKFALRAAREDHRRIHTGERPYVCRTCGKTFKAKASLYIHSKTHTDSFPYPCTYCKRKFRWRQQLLSHITTHTGEKKHFCEVCGKGFGVKNDLTKHKLVHSQDKPFLCLLCGLSFGQKRYLKNHEKARHKKEDAIKVVEPQ